MRLAAIALMFVLSAPTPQQSPPPNARSGAPLIGNWRLDLGRTGVRLSVALDGRRRVRLGAMRPTPLVLRTYLSRGALCWLGTHCVATPVMLLGGLDPFRLSPGAIVDLILVSVVVSSLATIRHRERTLLGNLAVHPLWIGGAFAAPAMIGEAGIRALAGIL